MILQNFAYEKSECDVYSAKKESRGWFGRLFGKSEPEIQPKQQTESVDEPRVVR